jgi:parvulin-like peptidyl-prolyl isomerase
MPYAARRGQSRGRDRRGLSLQFQLVICCDGAIPEVAPGRGARRTAEKSTCCTSLRCWDGRFAKRRVLATFASQAMLGNLRKSATSIFSWLILGALALVFGLQFGLPSDSLTLGKSSYVKVHGETIGDDDYRYQLLLLGLKIPFNQIDEKLRKALAIDEEVLESIVEREVLTNAAHDLGLEATERDAEDLVLAGHVILLGETLLYLDPKEDFNYDSFLNFVRALHVSEPRYLDLQRRELLARMVRDLVASSTVVSEQELRQIYDEGANRLTLRIARYSPLRFGELVDPTTEEIAAYQSAHEDELKKQYLAQGSRFAKLPKQARVFVIEVQKARLGPSGPKGAPDSKTDARAVVDAAHKRVVDGEDFRKVARDVSQHETAGRGGEVGWVGETIGTGVDPKVDEGLAKLEVGKVSDVIDGEKAYYLVLVRQRREGDISEAAALPELAEDGVRIEKGEQLARTAAEEDLSALKSGAALGDVFSGGSALGGDEGVESSGGKDVRVALDDTGSFPKGEAIPGVGPSSEIVDAAWAAEPGPGMLDALFEVGQDVVLAGLVAKEQGSDAGFAEIRKDLYKGAVERKGELVTSRWTNRLCVEAKGRGEIKASPDHIAKLIPSAAATPPAEGEPAPAAKPFEVCDRVGNRGGMMRVAAFGGAAPGQE